MYIEELETERGRWCQVCLGFPYLGAGDSLDQLISTALDTCDFVPHLQLAVRISVDAESRLRRCAIFTAPSNQREMLRRVVASLTRIEVAAPGSIEAAGNAAAFDKVMGAFPDNQLRTVPADLRRGTVSFVVRFRAGAWLEQLFLQSRALGGRFSYQMNAIQAAGVSDHVRAARYNLLAMRGLVGLPPTLLSMQERLTEALTTGAYWVEEHVGSSTKEGLLAAGQMLRRYVLASCPDIRPPLVFDRGKCPDLLAAGLHSSTRLTPRFDEAAAMAATTADVASLLAWHPGPILAKVLQRAARPADEIEAGRVSAPAVLSANGLSLYTGEKPFVFVSYRHSDLQTVVPCLRQLQESAVRFWLDAGIPGGAEWTQVLEERISHCTMFLLFLSQAAVDSKYVRREILMADALEKPIVSLRMGEPELRWGLKLVLSQYQMVQLGSQTLGVVVRDALHRHDSNRVADR